MLVLNAAAKNRRAADPSWTIAAWLSINELAKPWTEAIASGAWKIEGREKQLEYGLNAITPRSPAPRSPRSSHRGKINITDGPWIEIIGRSGGPQELAKLLEALIVFYGDDCCPGRDVAAVKVKNLERG